MGATSGSWSTTSMRRARRCRARAWPCWARAGPSFDFRDPWGNRVQVVGYTNIQFERTAGVRRALGIEDMAKTDAARHEIADRGLAD